MKISQVLESIVRLFSGPERLHLLESEDCCQWKGVECDNESGHVTKLNLSNPAGRHRHFDYAISDYNYPRGGITRLALNPNRPVSALYCHRSSHLYHRSCESPWHRDVKASFSRDVNASLSGEITPYLGNLSSLTHLDLEGNYNLSTKNLNWVSSLSSLQYLYMGEVKINHTKADWLHAINMLPSLLELSLCSCQLEQLPSSLTFLNFTTLFVLDLSYNSFNTSIPQWLFNLTSLTKLDLTFTNQGGKILDSFGRLGSLQYLYLAEGCRIGPKFPQWLQFQSSLTYVTLRNVGIKGTIPKEWFPMISDQLIILDLSNNQIKGNLPHQLVFPNVTKLFLQSNLFSGTIPSNISDLMPNLQYLDLSENQLVGTIPLSISKIKDLNILVLRRNNLSGKLPHNWNESQIGLRVVDISDNNIYGKIPSSMGFLGNLSILVLSNNNLSGEIPSSLQNCSIVSMDLGGNRLSGNLPSWIESNIFMLRLRSNLFSGTIPKKWCNLHKLCILDLAQNNLLGGIPDCFNNFTAMVDHNIFGYKPIENYTEKAYIVTKGREYEYDRTLQFVTCIDLSGNSLTGGIPIQITNLTRLGTLNLSMNHLIGSIPKNIGNMWWLETLDLKNNSLFGAIPGSMSSLTFLVHLNLSFNNLTGRIPSGNQLQTLSDATIYKGNPLLCGSPLLTKCPGYETSDGPTITGVDDKQGGDDYERIWFYASIGSGFVVGFWSVCGTLLLKKSCRHCYFRFCDDIKDRISLLIALKVVHLKRIFGLEKN
ncbi:hypothetical protein CMV_016952 [Castanea mollissima]|uniref:Leucine-rich repeat-containing N-terminal plant-type domain-containing protein n=1 Tax=Castanea mollissima TaxID=60419 RepID=A0A8J4QTC1_9ROSI|nr:hypothetical protein CMV_016952 [Castanea mollissima]